MAIPVDLDRKIDMMCLLEPLEVDVSQMCADVYDPDNSFRSDERNGRERAELTASRRFNPDYRLALAERLDHHFTAASQVVTKIARGMDARHDNPRRARKRDELNGRLILEAEHILRIAPDQFVVLVRGHEVSDCGLTRDCFSNADRAARLRCEGIEDRAIRLTQFGLDRVICHVRLLVPGQSSDSDAGKKYGSLTNRA